MIVILTISFAIICIFSFVLHIYFFRLIVKDKILKWSWLLGGFYLSAAGKNLFYTLFTWVFL
jgi:hypothetical protein